ncbi:MAG: hypothetical protein ACFFKA_05480 [Candidatus Thorarchaeota archaeon]
MMVKKENVIMAFVQLPFTGRFITLVICALIIGKDFWVILLAISYQILAFILIGVRLVSYLIVERKT